MVSIVIIEDEENLALSLRVLLERDRRESIKIVGIEGSVDTAIEVIDRNKPDIVFFDIHLSDGTAFDVLEKISYRDFQLVFTTAHPEYAIKGFELSAVHYLLKPISADRITEALNRILRNSSSLPQKGDTRASGKNEAGQPEILSISTQEGVYIIPLNDLVRCESSGSYISFYIHGGKRIMKAQTLNYYERSLPSDYFFRIHQSHLVNYQFVKSYRRDGRIVLKDGTILSVSQRKRAAFLDWIENKRTIK